MKKTPQQQAADLRKLIAHYTRCCNAYPDQRKHHQFLIKQLRKSLQRLKSKYKHIPDL